MHLWGRGHTLLVYFFFLLAKMWISWLEPQKPFWPWDDLVDENCTDEVIYIMEGTWVFDTVECLTISGLATSRLLKLELEMHGFKLLWFWNFYYSWQPSLILTNIASLGKDWHYLLKLKISISYSPAVYFPNCMLGRSTFLRAPGGIYTNIHDNMFLRLNIENNPKAHRWENR